jgi:Rrf2 family transcriptional regulator, iron-sulfur cluster assembly transcription factor
MAGFLNSTPGNKGGYVLAMNANEIVINRVLKALGGPMFDTEFCGTHSGAVTLCTHSVDCSSRSLWQMIQHTLDNLLDKVTLHDLVNPEKTSSKILGQLLDADKELVLK